MRRLFRGERNKGANLDATLVVDVAKARSGWLLLIKIDEPSSKLRTRKRRRTDTEQTANPNTHNGA